MERGCFAVVFGLQRYIGDFWHGVVMGYVVPPCRNRWESMDTPLSSNLQ